MRIVQCGNDVITANVEETDTIRDVSAHTHFTVDEVCKLIDYIIAESRSDRRCDFVIQKVVSE